MVEIRKCRELKDEHTRTLGVHTAKAGFNDISYGLFAYLRIYFSISRLELYVLWMIGRPY